jgi:hypothetical protein
MADKIFLWGTNGHRRGTGCWSELRLRLPSDVLSIQFVEQPIVDSRLVITIAQPKVWHFGGQTSGSCPSAANKLVAGTEPFESPGGGRCQ